MIEFDLENSCIRYNLKEAITSKHPNIFLAPVDTLPTTIRLSNCFKVEGINTIGELVQKTQYEMLRIPNFGKKTLKELEEVLAEIDLKLGMELKDYPPSDLDVIGPHERNVPITRERLIRAMRIASHRLMTACEVDDPVKSLDYAKLVEQLHRLLKGSGA